MTSSRCVRERFAEPSGLEYRHRACLVEQASLPVSGRAGWEACTTIPAGSRSYFVVKRRRRFKLDDVRQRFRLTPTEKRVALFVAAAFVLGLVTKCYRDAHPSPIPVQTHSGKSRVPGSFSASVDQPGAPNAGETARRRRRSTEKLDLSDSATKQEHHQR